MSESTQLAFDLKFDSWRLHERVSASARRIRIEVRSADEVVLVVPRRCPRRVAYAFLDSRRAWIERKLTERRLRDDAAPAEKRALRWDGTDRVPLRGREHLVQLRVAERFAFHVEQEIIVVAAPPKHLADRTWLVRRLREALREQARSDAEMLIAEEAPRLEVNVRGLRIAEQKTLWGSCGAGGRISLNWRLVLAPPQVFRYVAVHELAHLKHWNHSKRFWALVARQLPDYQTSRRWLRLHGAELHAWLRG